AQLLANRGKLLTSARRYYIDVVSEVAIRYHRDPNEDPKALHQALQDATTKKGIEFDLMAVAAVMAGRRRASTAAVLHAAAALHRLPARRRDQPRPAQDAVGPPGSHAGANRHRGWQGARPVGSLHGRRHPEPDRAGGNLPAPRSPARPLRLQG